MERLGEESAAPPSNRRRERRVRLSVPVEISWREWGESEAVSRVSAQSVDLSVGGLLCSFNSGGSFVPGDVLKISMSIPTGLRSLIPFSRIGGSSRVVRVSVQEQGKQVEVALAFCAPGTVRLASIVHP